MEQLEVALDSTTKRSRALEEELANLKKYLATAVPGAAPVRISRQELRPLTPADVASLRCVESVRGWGGMVYVPVWCACESVDVQKRLQACARANSMHLFAVSLCRLSLVPVSLRILWLGLGAYPSCPTICKHIVFPECRRGA